MISRVCRVSGAVMAMLTAATVCLAAEPAYAPSKGGIGGMIGVSSFRGDRLYGGNGFGDYAAGARPRFQFKGNFRYVVNRWLRWQVSPGFTWASYKGDEVTPFEDPRFPGDRQKRLYLALMLPISFEAQFVHQHGWWLYYVGAGPGAYRVWLENHREVLKDPVTLKLHRGLYPGVSGELGVEHFLKSMPSTSIDLSIGGDLAFATRNAEFPSGWNSSALAIGARIGGTYYFSTGDHKAKSEGAAPKP